jgi:hypothetical protein
MEDPLQMPIDAAAMPTRASPCGWQTCRALRAERAQSRNGL